MRRACSDALLRAAPSHKLRQYLARNNAGSTYMDQAVADVDSVVTRLYQGIVSGQRASLAQAITLVESTHPQKKASGQAILGKVLRYVKSKEEAENKFTFRVGISGSPGAGKSTLIEALGTILTSEGRKVAVLAVDPSSVTTGGSLMGDKTRMTDLARNPNAYIRASPSKGTMGGVTRSTHEAIDLCEGAGYGVVLVETVGVGQSEIAVSNMVDMFCVVVPPAAGDELQGMKRGIIEVADVVIINKSDGDLVPAARRAQMEYTSALKIMRKRMKFWSPKVLRVSSKTKEGIPELWSHMLEFHQLMISNKQLQVRRDDQKVAWLWDQVHDQIMTLFLSQNKIRSQVADLERQVRQGHLSPGFAADLLIRDFLNNNSILEPP